MDRRGFLFAAALAVLTLVLLAVHPALAVPPPWANGKPRHTTTTTAQPTTTVQATTTTLPATTTTGAMPTTTVTMGTCQAPLTINTGGTYSLGCYESTSTGTPAVTIATTQPVTIDRMLIKHKGYGVYALNTTGTNVTIRDSVFQATAPGSQVDQHALYLRQPASLVLEYNRLVDGHGVLLAGENIATSPLLIRYNDFVDVARYPKASVTSAIQFDKASTPNGAQISWNRIVSHHGRSAAEDVINMYQSNGGGTSGTRIEIDHNLIDGAYGVVADGANGEGFTGGGIDLGDSGGSWQVSHDNTIVRITNNGIMIPAGSNLEHYANRVVQSGIADDGTRMSSTFGNALTLFDNPSYPDTPSVVSMHDNLAGDHRRWNGTAWERHYQYTPACDPAGACSNNPSLGLSLTDDAAWLAEVNDAIADWDTARVAAGVTVGPRP